MSAESSPQSQPQIVSQDAHAAFEQAARRYGLNPDDRWLGRYVDYEIDHFVPIVNAYGINLGGQNVLEFGCNFGASAIVMAHLGATVTGVDVAEREVTVARLNVARYGFQQQVTLHHLTDTRRLPFADGQFAFVNCNSVLEYVHHTQLQQVLHEIDRVVMPRGRILVTGTSSRLWPREVHSGRWLVNYLPRVLDRVVGREIQRGVAPWTIRYGFGPHYRNVDALDGGGAFLRARETMVPPNAGMSVRAAVAIGRLLGVGPGMLAPSFSCLLEKNP